MSDTQTSSPLLRNIPAFLRTPATTFVSLPVESRIQELPFEQLTWENFEKLCLRLVESDAEIEYCRLYGERGDNQEGIDLFARVRQSSKFRTYQCKNESGFGPAHIKRAVNTFLVGEWVQKSDTFVLCTREAMISKLRTDEILEQTKVLTSHNIILLNLLPVMCRGVASAERA